jgi:arylsulfatase A-like enzyme
MGIGKMHWHPQRNPHGFHQVLLDESGRVESPDFRSDYRSWFWSVAPNLDPDATGIGWNDYRAKAYVLPERLHPTHWTGETAVSFLSTYDRPEPFFLKVSFARPHSPYDPPERFMRTYADVDLPEAVVGKWAARYAERSGPTYDIWRGDLGSDQVRRSRQGYYGSVSFVDEQIGRILEVLEDRGWLEQTLIIYTADHGDMTGDHHLWRKSYAYEASARIPMLMRWPTGLASAERGQVLTQPVELRDILPTFLDAASAPGAEELDGRSLLSLVRGNTTEWREYIDLEHDVCYSPENHWNALTDGHTKYIFHARDGEEQLFDLDNDPGELNDLGSDPAHQGRLRQWRERMVDHLAERGEKFVKDGKLVLRPERYLYSPNYPG